MTAPAWQTPKERGFSAGTNIGDEFVRKYVELKVEAHSAAAEDAAFEQIALHFDESEQHETADRVRRFAQRRRESR